MQNHSRFDDSGQHEALTLAIVAFLQLAFEGVPVNEIISDMAEKIYASPEQDGLDGTEEDAGTTP